MRAHAIDRLAAWDRALCRRFNGAIHFIGVRATLVVASRLGNGIFWYVLMAALLAFGGAGAVPAVLHMIAVGLVCTALYKVIKRGTLRARPYAGEFGISLCAAPLDQYSFPSGHTLHATAFAWIALAYFPALFWLLMPFAAAVAMSRVVLGLHYPSDVLAGAAIGAAVAELSLRL